MPMCMHLPKCSRTQMHLHTRDLYMWDTRGRDWPSPRGARLPSRSQWQGPTLSRMVTCEQHQIGSSAVLKVHRDRGSLGACRLGLETLTCPEEWGRVCLSMRTEELSPHQRVERHPEASWLSRLPSFYVWGRADLEGPDHVGVCLPMRIGATWFVNEWNFSRAPIVGGNQSWGRTKVRVRSRSADAELQIWLQGWYL